jgi:creatinine amidohydrolase
LGIGYAGDTEVFARLCQDLIDDPDSLPGWHAGEVETSGALYFAEEHVRMDRASKRLPANPEWMTGDMEKKDSGSGFEFKYRDFPIRVGMDQWEYGDVGIMGDPMLASKEKGEKIYERMTDLFADFLKDLKKVEVEVHTRDFPERV